MFRLSASYGGRKCGGRDADQSASSVGRVRLRSRTECSDGVGSVVRLASFDREFIQKFKQYPLQNSRLRIPRRNLWAFPVNISAFTIRRRSVSLSIYFCNKRAVFAPSPKAAVNDWLVRITMLLMRVKDRAQLKDKA